MRQDSFVIARRPAWWVRAYSGDICTGFFCELPAIRGKRYEFQLRGKPSKMRG
jgi:hypothetical protein